jgi:hypothetical protein
MSPPPSPSRAGVRDLTLLAILAADYAAIRFRCARDVLGAICEIRWGERPSRRPASRIV